MNAIAQVSAARVSGPKLDNRRVMAAIVDFLIVSAGAAVVLVAGDALTGERQSALGAVVLGWALYYFFALESGAGQTVGKKLMKLRVVRADGRGAGMREIAVRTILRVVDNYLIGLIVMLATGERRQRIGDLAAGTMVVDASAPAVAPPAPPAAAPVAEAEDAVRLEPDRDDPVEPEPEPPATETITLPARAARPATLNDITEPGLEDGVAEEPVPEEEQLPADSEVERIDDVDEAAQADPVEERPADGPVSVKSVETVSAMDLIMGAAEEDAAGEQSSEAAQQAEDSATG